MKQTLKQVMVDGFENTSMYSGVRFGARPSGAGRGVRYCKTCAKMYFLYSKNRFGHYITACDDADRALIWRALMRTLL